MAHSGRYHLSAACAAQVVVFCIFSAGGLIMRERVLGARNGTKLLHLQVPFSPNAGCAHSIVNFRQTRHLTLRSSRRVQGDESTTGVPYCCAQQAGRNSTARVERAQRSRHTCKELRLWAERLIAIVVLLSGGALHIRAIRAGDLNSPQLACGRRCTRRVSVG